MIAVSVFCCGLKPQNAQNARSTLKKGARVTSLFGSSSSGSHGNFNSQVWSTDDFSLQCRYIIKQTGDENKENHQLEDIVLMRHSTVTTDVAIYMIYWHRTVEPMKKKPGLTSAVKRTSRDAAAAVKLLQQHSVFASVFSRHFVVLLRRIFSRRQCLTLVRKLAREDLQRRALLACLTHA